MGDGPSQIARADRGQAESVGGLVQGRVECGGVQQAGPCLRIALLLEENHPQPSVTERVFFIEGKGLAKALGCRGQISLIGEEDAEATVGVF